MLTSRRRQDHAETLKFARCADRATAIASHARHGPIFRSSRSRWCAKAECEETVRVGTTDPMKFAVDPSGVLRRLAEAPAGVRSLSIDPMFARAAITSRAGSRAFPGGAASP